MNRPESFLIEGYRLKIIDGNHLGATEHRLSVLRQVEGGPLPRQSLVVLDPQSKLVVDVFPCEDAYTQERALLNGVLKTVVAQDLWIGDRNFCTRSFLIGIAAQRACERNSSASTNTPDGAVRITLYW